MFNFDIETNEIYLYDEIGPSYWGLIDAESVITALDSMNGNPVTVRLNTPGGSVDEGVAIYNALKRYSGGVTTIVDSIAASMGSYIMQAGTNRIVAKNAMVMIHDPWTIAFGNAGELRKTADVLQKYGERMIPDYAARSGLDVEAVKSIMEAETWYTGQEAIDAGWADSMGDESEVEPMVAGLHKIASRMPQSLSGKIADQLKKKPDFSRVRWAKNRRQPLSYWKERAKAIDNVR